MEIEFISATLTSSEDPGAMNRNIKIAQVLSGFLFSYLLFQWFLFFEIWFFFKLCMVFVFQ